MRDEKVKALRAIRPYDGRRGGAQRRCGRQYAQGLVGGRGGQPATARRTASTAKSTTETYVGLRLEVDNWRWAGVPFYIRTGKRLPKRAHRGGPHVQARPPPAVHDAGQPRICHPNALVLRIQPDEGITLRFGAKVPGGAFEVRDVLMDFSYGASFLQETPDAYERLLLDAMIGDPTLFIRSRRGRAGVEASATRSSRPSPAGTRRCATYEAGTWGPAEADALLRQDGRAWRTP